MSYSLEQLSEHTAAATRLLPGPDYYEVLSWVHGALKPDTYIEIGIRNGASLGLADARTACIGVDPNPIITGQLPPNTRVYPLTSDAFFSAHCVQETLGKDSFDFAFIDGLHTFDQSLRDFIHLERWAGKQSVIAIHDCIPLNPITSQQTRVTAFYSGDVWKIAACLKKYRPDLRCATVKTAPTGLCLVAGLNPASEILPSKYDSLLDEFGPLEFRYYRKHPKSFPPLLPNTSEATKQFLQFSLRAEMNRGSAVL